MNLEDLLFNMYSEPKESKEEVLQDIKKNSENVIIIFDGITGTELSSLSVVKDLVENLLPDAKIVTTCRPDQSEDFLTDWPVDWFRVEVKGFSDESIRAYLTQMLSAEPDSLSSVLNNLELFSLCHVPICDILLDLYSHVKDYETQTGRSVLPALQPVYQSGPAVWSIDLSERKASLLLEVLKLQPEKKPIELKCWSDEESEVRSFLQCLSYISQLRFYPDWPDPSKQIKFLVNLLSQAAEWEEQTGEKTLKLVSSVCTYSTFPFPNGDTSKQSDFLLDLFSHVKDYETQTGRSVLPALQPVYQSAPAVWYIDLSERKASLLLEVLKLQPEKKPVELNGWSDEESEVRSFLQCLSYISQLRFYPLWSNPSKRIKFLVNLLSQAAEWDEQTGEKTLKLVSSMCTYCNFPYPCGANSIQSDFLLDLYSHVKDYETQTGRSVLPALQPVYQSAPAVWSIDLSKRKASLLLEVLKFQPEKKRVELKGWSDEVSEVTSFLQCLPYISQLRFDQCWSDPSKWIKFLVDLLSQAADWEEQTGEKTLKLVSSVCTYKNFPYRYGDKSKQSEFLLDLYTHVKDYETQTGKSVLPAFQPVYQSASPAVWSIDLSERKASLLLEVLKLQPEKKPVELKGLSDEESEVRSFLQCLSYISQLRQECPSALQPVYQSAPAVWSIDSERKASLLLEVLKLQPEKKPVELKGWSDEESEVRSFLQCLPYISQLSFYPWGSDPSKQIKFLVDLLSQAAEWEEQTGEKTLKLVSSVCTYNTFPFPNGDNSEHSDFLLDLFSYVKDYETQTGRSVLPALQPVYQSASPAVWSIDLRKRKASLLLEVLKLQPEKKPVKLSGWSVEESKVRSFLQCLPYISQLRPNSGILQQLTVVVYEAQDKDLTQWFLEKVGGDLTSCRLDWEVLLSLLQHSTHNITVDLRKNRFLEKNISDLLPFLGRVTLKSPSKALLLQLLDLVCEGIEEGLLRHTESLCRALDGELDLSETRLDQKVCGSLALVLEHSEGLSKLDLSHCQLTDHHLQPLITHLHKVQVLDLSHNYITDALTDRILQLVSTNTSIHTVRLFNNRIMNRTAFLTEERFEI
ncbi:uncharacterized protein ACWYII_031902 [Salvelinus alpinus]